MGILWSDRIDWYHPENCVWLGGSDSASEGDWKWVTGERWVYTNWQLYEPNNAGEVEDWLVAEIDPRPGGLWNDRSSDPKFSYLLEFGYPTDPSKADTDGDGFNDSIESHYASDPNDASATPNTVRPSGFLAAWGDN